MRLSEMFRSYQFNRQRQFNCAPRRLMLDPYISHGVLVLCFVIYVVRVTLTFVVVTPPEPSFRRVQDGSSTQNQMIVAGFNLVSLSLSVALGYHSQYTPRTNNGLNKKNVN